MARVMELFVIINAMCGIAAFLGVRLVIRRSRDAAKRGIDIITGNGDDEAAEPKELGSNRYPAGRPR